MQGRIASDKGLLNPGAARYEASTYLTHLGGAILGRALWFSYTRGVQVRQDSP